MILADSFFASHAFFFIYGHQSQHFGGKFSTYGYTGHGASWHDIAYALAKAVKDPTLWGVPLELGRDVSMAVELNAAQWAGEYIDPTPLGN